LRARDSSSRPPQHPQHHQLRIRGDLSQSLVPQGDHDDRVRAGSVSLAALAGIEHPGPGGELGRHIQHPLAAGQQPLRQRAADPVRTFHRPDALRPLPGDLQQLAVTAGLSAEPARGPQDLPAVPGLDRHRHLVRVNPDDHPVHLTHLLTLRRSPCQARTGNAISSWANPS
jgi:hypothetical protein